MNVQTAWVPTRPATQPAVYKPLHEQWTVEGKDNYTSTSDLVSQGDKLQDRHATYHAAGESDPAPFTRGERVANTAGRALEGAAIGAGVGAAGGVVLSLLAGAADILNAFAGGHMAGVSSAVMLVPIALGAAGGAGIGGVSGAKEQPAAATQDLEGVLKAENGHVFFYPQGSVEKQVDLTEFQSAPVGPVIEAESTPSSKLGNTLKGAAVGALIAPAIIVPLAGMAAGGVVGYQAGLALDKRTQLGRGLGVTLGLASTAGAVALANVGGLKPFAALSAGLGVAGAALGNSVLTRMHQNEAHHEYGSQWWNQAPQNQDQP